MVFKQCDETFEFTHPVTGTTIIDIHATMTSEPIETDHIVLEERDGDTILDGQKPLYIGLLLSREVDDAEAAGLSIFHEQGAVIEDIPLTDTLAMVFSLGKHSQSKACTQRLGAGGKGFASHQPGNKLGGISENLPFQEIGRLQYTQGENAGSSMAASTNPALNAAPNRWTKTGGNRDATGVKGGHARQVKRSSTSTSSRNRS